MFRIVTLIFILGFLAVAKAESPTLPPLPSLEEFIDTARAADQEQLRLVDGLVKVPDGHRFWHESNEGKDVEVHEFFFADENKPRKPGKPGDLFDAIGGDDANSSPRANSPGEDGKPGEGRPGKGSPEGHQNGFPDGKDPYKLGDSLISGLKNGAIEGGTVLIIEGLIKDKDFRHAMELYGKAANDRARAKTETEGAVIRVNAEIMQKLLEAARIREGLEKQVLIPQMLSRTFLQAKYREYAFKTKDPKILAALRNIHKTIAALPADDPLKMTIKKWAFESNIAADLSYHSGMALTSLAHRRMALAIIDGIWSVGLTGTGRAAYEAFCGEDMLTGRILTTTERAIALTDMVAKAYGKLSKGVMKHIVTWANRVGNLGAYEAAVEARDMVERFLSDPRYEEKQLWKTEVFLELNEPELRRQILQGPAALDYLEIISDTEKLEIFRPGFEDLDDSLNHIYKQELSLEALAVHRELKNSNDRGVLFARKSQVPLAMNARGRSTETEFEPLDGLDPKGAKYVETFKLDSDAGFLVRSRPDTFYFNPNTREFEHVVGEGFEVIVAPQTYRKIKTVPVAGVQ